jgi:membrane-bound serine protease (ClpP class)
MNSRRIRYKHRLVALLPFCGVVVLVLVALAVTMHSAEASTAHIDRMVLNEDINPASLQFLKRAVSTAESDGAQALVIEIDTPGGDLDSMKAMVQAELSSTVPVIAFVSPSGGRAASAGSFVALAAQVVAMAPTTRIGAASPVTSTGGDIGSTLKSKIENDLVAQITGIQQQYGRNIPLATKMVTSAASYDNVTAVKEDIVDVGAANLSDLLANKVDGRVVKLASGKTVTLQTAGVPVQTIDQAPVDTLYYLLLDPNVIFLLFVVAMVGIYVEISHPGIILPGVAGSIALLLFLFAVGSISPNWAGLGLMALAFVLLVLDVRLPSHGVLTVGAVISLIFGALLFFNSGGPYQGQHINPLVVYAVGAVVGMLGLSLVTVIVRVQRRPVTTGKEGMIGATVVATTPLLPEGRVSYEGEDWSAVLDAPVKSADPGTSLRIVSVEGLRLHVLPVVDTLSKSSPKYIREA